MNTTARLTCCAVLAVVTAACSGTATEPASPASSRPPVPTATQAEHDEDHGAGHVAAQVDDHEDGDHEDGDHDAQGSTELFGSYTLVDEDYGTVTTVTVADGLRTIETNALPDHETGEFPNAGNPNTIAAQDLTWTFPATGTYLGVPTDVRVTGVAVNGIKFEPGTAEVAECATGETYRVEALQGVYDLGLDLNNAHVQPNGEYHYHGLAELLVDTHDSGDDLVHVGFAADGFAIYVSRSSAYESGYSLSATARTGTDCTVRGPFGSTVDLDGTAPDGTYTSDWTWSDTTGDLDECNGTTIDGEYSYLITEAYPYIGRCLMGEPAADAGATTGRL